MTNLKLESVSLEGFGSFKEKVTYPLNERGLVLVRGTNKDGGGDRYVLSLGFLFCITYMACLTYSVLRRQQRKWKVVSSDGDSLGANRFIGSAPYARCKSIRRC